MAHDAGSGTLTANAKLQAAAIRHAVFVQRFRNGTAADVAAFLRNELHVDLLRLTRDRLARIVGEHGVEPGPATTARLDRLFAEVQRLTAASYGVAGRTLTDNLLDFARYEAEFTAQIIDRAIPARAKTVLALEAKLPTPAILRGVVTSRPFEGATLKNWFTAQAVTTQAAYEKAVKLGVSEGESIDAIVNRITRGTDGEGVLPMARRHVESVTRTAVNHVSNEASMAVMQENEELFEGWRFVATLDASTTLVCSSRDGTVYSMDDLANVPPLHWGALVTGTRIITRRGSIPVEDVTIQDDVLTHAGRFRRVYAVMQKATETPKILALKTSSGRVLRVTHEHPVLTLGHGWKRADQVRSGDQVFEHPKELPECVLSRLPRAEQSVVIHAHNRPSDIDEPTVPYRVLFDPTRMTAAVELQGDAIRKGEVDDVGPLGPLEFEGYAGRRKVRHERSFARRWVCSEAIGHGAGLLCPRDWVAARIPGGHPRRMNGGQARRPIGVAGTPMVLSGNRRMRRTMNADRFQAAAHWNPVTLAPRLEHGFPEAHFALDGAKRHAAGEVLLSDDGLDRFPNAEIDHSWLLSTITEVVEEDSTADVWNLAVDGDETYVADGVIVHNCRSTKVGVLKSFRDLGIDLDEIPAGTRASMRGEVPAKLTYDEWLRGEPAAVQDDILGPARAKLFRAGAKVGDFIDARDRTLTLSDLRSLERRLAG